MTPEFVAGATSTTIRWLLEPAVRVIVLGALTALVLWSFRTRNTLTRLAAWTTVLYAALALPWMIWIAPPITVVLPILPAQSKVENSHDRAFAVQKAGDPTRESRLSNEKKFSAIAHAVVPAIPANEKRNCMQWSTGFVVVYLLGLVALAIRLVISIIVAQRLRRSAVPLKQNFVMELFDRSVNELTLRFKPEILESSSVHVPLTLGTFRPAIVIPVNWRDWEEEKLRAVILHELSHVQRRDTLTHALAAAHRCVFWFSPFAWWLERHLAELGEAASDQAAINAGLKPTYYAEVLMSFFTVIRDGQRRVNLQGVWMARGSRAVQRIERVLSSELFKPSKAKKSVIVAATAGALVVVCSLAAVRPKLVMAAPQVAGPAASLPAPPNGPIASPSVPPAGVPGAPVGVPVPPQILSPTPPLPPMQLDVPRPPTLRSDIGQIIAGIQIHGSQKIHPDAIRAAIHSRVGDVFDEKLLRQDFNSLWETNNFADIRFDKEKVAKGIVLHIYVTERTNAGAGAVNSEDGTHFVIVSGQSMTMSGNDHDVRDVELLKKRIVGDFIWFKKDGKAYTIRDTQIVQAAKAFYAPMQQLGQEEKLLGEKQRQLGVQQQELGKQIRAVRVDVPVDLTKRLQEVETKIAALGGSADMGQLGRLQTELGNLQGQLDALQDKAGQTQDMLGDKQEELGKQQSALRDQKEIFIKKREDAALQATQLMQYTMHKSLSDGTANAVE